MDVVANVAVLAKAIVRALVILIVMAVAEVLLDMSNYNKYKEIEI